MNYWLNLFTGTTWKEFQAAGAKVSGFRQHNWKRAENMKWVVDQYQVCTDKRSGITSDPNRADDEQYTVRLVGQVVRVSVETARIVKSLPAAFA